MPVAAHAQHAEPSRIEVAIPFGRDTSFAAALSRWAAAVDAASGGSVSVALATGDGRVAGSRALSALASGAVDMTLVGWWVAAAVVADLNLPALPMFHGRRRDIVRQIIDGPVGNELNRALEEAAPVQVLGPWLDLGAGQLFFARQDVEGYSSLRDRRLLLAGGRAMLARYRALGVVPYGLDWDDATTSLHVGISDGILAPYAAVGPSGLAEAGIRLVFEDAAVQFHYLPLFSRRRWEALPESVRVLLAETWSAEIGAMRSDSIGAADKVRDAMQKSGVRIVAPTADGVEQARHQAMAVQPEIVATLGMTAALVAAAEQQLRQLAP